MKKSCLLFITMLWLFLTPLTPHAAVKIVASTSDLASIAEYVGGDKVEVESIASGKSNPHFVEVLPSYMIKVARADIYLKVGMELDPWADYIIDGSRNGDIVIVDCSKDIDPLERPTRKIDASMGDVHPMGNPHYWLSPGNGIRIAQAIVSALKLVDAENSGFYDAKLEAFKAKTGKKIDEWMEKARPLHGLEIVTYHNSWPYFCETFGIEVVGFIEPKPGIEPTPTHTAKLVDLIRANGIRIIGKEPYFADRTPRSIARLTGAAVVDLPPSTGGVDEASDYFALFETLIDILTNAIKE